MAKTYFGEVYNFAVKGIVWRTDGLQILAASVLPGVFKLLGWPMPEDANVAVLAYIGYAIAAFVILRLVSAPFFIWKRDQNEIAELRSALNAPAARRYQAFQDHFMNDRAELARSLTAYIATDMILDMYHTVDADAELRGITRRAQLFLSNLRFRQYWTNFCAAFRQSVWATKLLHYRGDEMTFEDRAALSARRDYDLDVMRASATALVGILTESPDYAEWYISEMTRIDDLYTAADKSRPAIELMTEIASRLPPGIATETPPKTLPD